MHQIRHGKKNKSMQLGQHRPSASLALNRRKRAACARAVDEARTWALQEERTEAWWHALRRIETTSSEVSGTTPPWCGLKFGDGNKKRLAGFTGLARGEKKEHKKNLQQKTLAAWCTQHRNQAHKSRMWLQDEKHQNHREDQRGDHELACSRNKNQRPVGGDRKNQTRRTDLCGRKMEQKTRVQEEKGNQVQHIWNSKKQFFHFNKNYNRSIQPRRSPPPSLI
jgi:hypothetical protein